MARKVVPSIRSLGTTAKIGLEAPIAAKDKEMSEMKAKYEDRVKALKASIVAKDEVIVAIQAAHAAEISTKDEEMAVKPSTTTVWQP